MAPTGNVVAIHALHYKWAKRSALKTYGVVATTVPVQYIVLVHITVEPGQRLDTITKKGVKER
jgi:hypothetical protein